MVKLNNRMRNNKIRIKKSIMKTYSNMNSQSMLMTIMQNSNKISIPIKNKTICKQQTNNNNK